MSDQVKPESSKSKRYRTDPEFRRKQLANNKLYWCMKNKPKPKKADVTKPAPTKRGWVSYGWGYLGSLQGQVNTEHRAGGN